MKTIFIILIVIGGIILLGTLIKIITRNRNSDSYDTSSSGGSFWDKVKDACCIKR